MEHCEAVKSNSQDLHITLWIHLNIVLNEKSKNEMKEMSQYHLCN